MTFWAKAIRSDVLGNMSGRFPDQLEIAQGGVVIQSAGDKPCLVERVGIGNDLLGKSDQIGRPREHEWPLPRSTRDCARWRRNSVRWRQTLPGRARGYRQ